MPIYIYNSNIEDHTEHKNNYPIYRPYQLSNPYTWNGKKSSLAKLSFETKKEALDTYRIYFRKMYEMDKYFKEEVDEIYEKYKNGETIYLQCFCGDGDCHGNIIRDELQQRLIKEKFNEIKKEKQQN